VRKGQLICFGLVACFLAISGPLLLLAHHGQGAYEGKTVTLNGTVTKFEWTNPHCILTIAVKNDQNGTENWYAEFLPPSQMSRSGWDRDVIKMGDQVTMTGRPGKKGEHILYLQTLLLPDGRKLDRDARGR